MNLFELFAKLTLDSSEYESGLDDAERKGKSFGSKIGKGFKTLGKVGVAALGTATASVTAFAGASVKAGAAFDASMSQVAATMGYTTSELNDATSEASKNMAQLRDFAQQMGASTAFSASEAADALNYMALAGYDAETSMSMLPNVLNLAAAGGIDLARASDMVTDAQSALGLSLEETRFLVDEMAAASSKSNTSVSQLGDAILTVGGTAKNLKGGTVELSTALGILADNGIKGAEGGTALRNIILSLSTPTDQAAKKMKALGLDVFDAEGNMRGLEDIFNDLNGALDGMTQGEQLDVLNTLFNKVDLKSANALLATSTDRWNELSEAINYSDAAAEAMAKTQLDNLTGDVTLFKSALEGVKIAISDKITPSLRKFVQFGSTGLSSLLDAFNENGLTGVMDAFGTLLSDGLNMIIEMLPQVTEAGMQLLGALGQGIMTNLPVIVDAATQIILMLVQGLITALPSLVEGAIQIVSQLATFIAANLPTLIPAIINMVLTIANALINNVGLLVDGAIAIILALTDGIIDNLPTLIEQIPEIIIKIVDALIENAPKLLKAGTEIIGKLIMGLLMSLPSVVTAIGKIIGKIATMFMELPSKAIEWGKDLLKGFIDGIKSKVTALVDAVKGVAAKVKSFLGFSEPEEGPLSNFHTYAPDMMKLFAQGIKDNTHLITDQIKKSFDFGEQIVPVKTNMTGNDNVGGSVVNNYTINVNQPVATPDEMSREIRTASQYGLIGGVALG